MTARAWAQPQGHADIAPSRYDRIERDGYLTLDAPWLVPALLRSVPEISGRLLEPAAGRGHISLELRSAGFDVVSRDIRRYLVPLVDGIGVANIRELDSLAGFDWVVTNLPYRDLTELTAHLTRLGARDRCGVALLVRAEWLIPKARRRLVHEHPHFAGAVMLTARPRWVERGDDDASPRHNFAWAVGAERRASVTRGFASPASRSGSRCSSPCLRKGRDPAENGDLARRAAREARIRGADLRRQEARFAGAVMLTARPRWVERGGDDASPRHNFAWAVWSGTPRVGDRVAPLRRQAGAEADAARPV